MRLFLTFLSHVVHQSPAFELTFHVSRCALLLLQRLFFQRSDRVKGVDLHPTEPWYAASLHLKLLFASATAQTIQLSNNIALS